MANNYNNLLEELSSEKFYLVTLNGRKDVSSYLSLVSGTTYSYTTPFVEGLALTVDGVSYTKVETSSPASTQFYFDDSSKQLIVNFGAALTTQLVVLEHQLYYTNDCYRRAQVDPRTPSGREVVYEARLANNPAFTFSQRDIYNGTLSSATASLSLINVDNYFQKYLTSDDSFYNGEVVFHQCINSIENIKTIFRGTVSDISFGNNNIDFRIIDRMAGFDQTLFSGSSYLKSIVNRTDYPNVIAEKENAIIYKNFGARTPVTQTTNNERSVLSKGPTTGLEQAGKVNYILSNTFEGINIDATGFQNTENRDWILYKYNGEGVLAAAITGVSPGVPGRYTLTLNSVANNRLIPGDNVYLQGQNVIDSHGVVKFQTSDNIYVVDFSRTQASGGASYPVPTTADTLVRFETSQVQLEASDRAYPNNAGSYIYNLVESVDFSLSTDSNGNRVLTLINDFETLGIYNTPVSGGNTGDPPSNPIKSNYTLRFVAWNDSIDRKHSTLIENLINGAGFSTNSTSFTSAGTAEPLEFAYSVPFFKQSFVSYRETIERLLRSSFSFVNYSYDNDEFEYFLIDNAGTPIESLDEFKIIDNSKTYQIEYRDIISEFNIFNDYDFLSDITFESGSPYGVALKTTYNYQDSGTTNSDRALNLFGTSKSKTLTLYVDGSPNNGTNVTNLITRLSKFIFNHFRTIELTVKTNFDLDLGNTVTVTSEKNYNNQSADFRIIEKRIRNNDITFTLTE